MRITNISVSSYSTGSFMVTVGDPETYVQINMTDEESDRLRGIVTEMFLSRQKDIANDIAMARPLMIELQSEPVQEYKPQPIPDDDIPF